MAAGVGLMTASAALVHLSGGYVELHFHFFVMVAVIALYRDWAPFLAALGYVLLHHGLLGTLAPETVYNHPAAWANPWRWAGVHGGFILAISAACLVSWRVAEAEYARRLAERQRIEAALRANERRLAQSQEIAQLGSWEWDIASGVLIWSDELFRIYGLEPGQVAVAYEGFLARVHPVDRALVDGTVKRAAADGRPFAFEHRVVLPDGGVRVHHGRGEVVVDDAGRPLRMVGTSQVVTERKRLEGELRAAKEAAEEASRLKSEFLSTVTHELRTPLTSIKGFVELLLDEEAGELSPLQAQFLGIVRDNADHQVGLVNDVLDLAKVEAGRLELSPDAVDLGAATLRVRAELAPQAAAKRLGLAVDVPPGLPPAWADPDRVHQILLNLAGNAVKFTEEGRVTIAARANGSAVEVAVADTGVGIAPEALPHVFDEFRQADGSTTRRFGGTGLGLAIAKKLAELQGGSIAVASKPGTGSTFTLRLPAAAPLARATAQRRPTPSPALSKPWGSGGRTATLLAPTSPQSRSGNDGRHSSG